MHKEACAVIPHKNLSLNCLSVLNVTVIIESYNSKKLIGLKRFFSILLTSFHRFFNLVTCSFGIYFLMPILLVLN